MPPIENLPRPWLLAAMTGVPISALVGSGGTVPQDDRHDVEGTVEDIDDPTSGQTKPSTH